MPTLHLQLNQLDKPHADVMIDELAKNYQALNEDSQKGHSSLDSRHFLEKELSHRSSWQANNAISPK